MNKLWIARVIAVVIVIIGYVVLASIGVDASIVGPIAIVALIALLFIPFRR